MRAPGNAANPQRGSSLIELMIGVILAGVGLSGIYLLTIHSAKLRRVDDETNLALQVCREQIELARELPFASLPGRDGTGFAIDADHDGVAELAPVPGDTDGLAGALSVTTERSAGGESVYRITAAATWKGVQGVRSIWLESLVANRSAR